MGIDIPQVLELALKLREKAGYNVRTDVINITEIKEEIERCLREKDFLDGVKSSEGEVGEDA